LGFAGTDLENIEKYTFLTTEGQTFAIKHLETLCVASGYAAVCGFTIGELETKMSEGSRRNYEQI
jgi:hypothetical protein